MEWAFLVVGMLLVAAIWDIGRRIADRIATRELAAVFDTHRNAINARVGDLESLRETVAEHGTNIARLQSAVEGVKAQRPRAGWGPMRT